MENDFFESFRYALDLKGESCSFQRLKNRINSIQSYEEIKLISKCPNDELYVWIPMLVFNLFGYEMYKECDLNIDEQSTYILFRPNEKKDFSIIDDIRKMKFSTKKYKYRFTHSLVASIYGGFPWFKSYCKACDRLEIWNKEGYVYSVFTNNSEGCIKKLVELKNNYRIRHPENTVRIKLENEMFDGVIHSFHSPNCIENKMHCMAIENEILEEIYE